jgi:hypothetical protein
VQSYHKYSIQPNFWQTFFLLISKILIISGAIFAVVRSNRIAASAFDDGGNCPGSIVEKYLSPIKPPSTRPPIAMKGMP